MKLNLKRHLAVRDQLKVSIQSILQEALREPLHVRVLSNIVEHDTLQPEGDIYTIRLRVETHPRTEE